MSDLTSLTTIVSPYLTQLASDAHAGDKIAAEVIRIYNHCQKSYNANRAADCQVYLNQWKKHRGIV